MQKLLRKLCNEYVLRFSFFAGEGMILLQIRIMTDIPARTGQSEMLSSICMDCCMVQQQEVRQSLHCNWICKTQISCLVLKS